MRVNNKQRQCALSTTKRIVPFFFFAGYFWRAEGFCPPKISKRGHHCGSSSSWTLANTATSPFLHADTPLSVASKINGQEIGIQDEGNANDNKDLMEHIKDLWSYVFNLQKARQTGDAIKPANSLVFYLTQLGEANVRGSEMQDALFHNPQLLIEPLERSLTQAFRAAGDAEDYRLILRLVDASIVYAKRYSIPVLTPRLFGEACHALSQTEVNTSKIKYVWNHKWHQRKKPTHALSHRLSVGALDGKFHNRSTTRTEAPLTLFILCRCFNDKSEGLVHDTVTRFFTTAVHPNLFTPFWITDEDDGAEYRETKGKDTQSK